MGFSGKVHHLMGLKLIERFAHGGSIANICLQEPISRTIRHWR
jgi:hypothetical protein